MPVHLGAVSLKKSHDIVILLFCNIVKGQANYLVVVEYIKQEIAMKIGTYMQLLLWRGY